MDTDFESVIEPMLAARADHVAIGSLPVDIPDVDAAYGVQRALVPRLGRTLSGWKIGCTNAWAQEMTGTNEPFYGRMFAEGSFLSPAQIPASELFHPILEPEIAFWLGRDLLPKEAPFTESRVLESIAGLAPAIEVVDCRYEEGWSIDLVKTIADNGVHGFFVLGGEATDWRSIDRAAIPILVDVNGEYVIDGIGANALGDPLNALVWLANKCAGHGQALRTGDVITTGNVANAAVHSRRGDMVIVDFGSLGRLEASFT